MATTGTHEVSRTTRARPGPVGHDLRVRWILILLVGALVGAGGVLAVDALRGPDVPGPCGAALQEPTGELRTDGDVVGRAWAALTDPEVETTGELAGSRPVAARSCLLFAGVLDGTDGPTVVFAETTVAGYQSLLRVAEVRLGESAPQVGVGSHAVLLGSELRAGLVLPLSGAYLAPDRVTGVTHVRPGRTQDARRLADRVYALDIGPDRTLAPNDQLPAVDAALLLEDLEHEPLGVVIPAAPASLDPLGGRAALQVYLDGGAPADAATLQRIAAALPALSADPRLRLILDRAQRHPALTVELTAAEIVFASPDPAGRDVLPRIAVPAAP